MTTESYMPPPPLPPDVAGDLPPPPPEHARFYEVMHDYSTKVADAPPVGEWAVLNECRFVQLMWAGHKRDLPKLLPTLKQFATMHGFDKMMDGKKPDDQVLPQLYAGPFDNGECFWTIAPLAIIGSYWFDNKKNLYWFEVGNIDAAPALPPAKPLRRKLVNPGTPPELRYGDWWDHAQRCLKHPEWLTDWDARFLRNIVDNFDMLSAKQWDVLKRLTEYVTQQVAKAKAEPPVTVDYDALQQRRGQPARKQRRKLEARAS